MPEPDALDFKIRDINKSICEGRLPIRGWEMQVFDYTAPGEYRPLSGVLEIEPGTEWDNSGVTCFFSCRLKIPEELLGKEVYLELDPGGESVLYVNGRLRRGINERYILLSPAAGEEYELRIEAVRNFQMGIKYPRFFAEDYPRHYFQTANLVVINHLVEKYYYLLKTVKAVLDSPEVLSAGAGEEARGQLEAAVRNSLKEVNFFTPDRGRYLASIEEAHRVLDQRLGKISEESFQGLRPGTVFISGHSHLDLAYKWPLRETIRKAARTLSTAVELLERYEGLYFIQSQPQVFAYLKEYYPRLYRKVREKIEAGRLEPTGAMWVEADTNLPSGESLVRQLIHGQRFLEEELGIRSEVCWLPDTFGFSGALPQILKKAGLRYFFTSKLTWNDTNQYPHNLMRWEGIDGSSINAYLLPRGYSGELNPGELIREWRDFQEKEEGGEVLYLYGYGDGGGGVTAELMETLAALEKVPPLPKLRKGELAEHLSRVFRSPDKLPSWRGELYFEKHRGIYTSQARLKEKNRRSEFLYREAEVLTVLARLRGIMDGMNEGPADLPGLEEGWKLILKNQFHDILPGSCIAEVVSDALADYQKIEELGREQRDRAFNYLLSRTGGNSVHLKTDCFKADPLPERTAVKPVGVRSDGDGYDDDESSGELSLAVFNSLCWSRSGMVKIEPPEGLFSGRGEEMVLKDCEGNYLPVQKTGEGYFTLVEDIPPFGCRTYRLDFQEGIQEGLRGMGRTHINGESGGGFPGPDARFDALVLENRFFRLQFNRRGNLSSIYDKRNERELIPEGEEGNQLQIFEDRSTYFDAWDLNISEDKMWVIDEVELLEIKERGPVYQSVLIRKRFNKSLFEQEVVLYEEIPRIDFRTRVDWQERQMLLRAAFPVDITAARASYDIAFGNLERAVHNNTSWERARSEVPAHKWADLSEVGYGVSLLNDCKYGYDVKGQRLRLTLLKGGIFPDPRADLGEHRFTYALYPHKYGFRRGGTVQAGYELNQPLLAECFKGNRKGGGNGLGDKDDRGDRGGKGNKPDSEKSVKRFSFFEVEGENIILETLKEAEDGRGFIFRFYEAWGARSTARVRTVLPPVRVEECSLLEEPLIGVPGNNGKKSLRPGSTTLHISGSGFNFRLDPYEIKTFRVSF